MGIDLWKLAQQFGETGLILFFIYKLIDKWAPRFLEAQTKQTDAMVTQASSIASLATTVQQGQADQREVLIAVRVLAEKIEQQKDYLLMIERSLKEGVNA
jgi:hypothetical protein